MKICRPRFKERRWLQIPMLTLAFAEINDAEQSA